MLEEDKINVMEEEKIYSEHSKHYSENKFWKKIKQHYKSVGKQLLTFAITLFFTLKDSDTPKWCRGIIISALGYFIFPFDIIPDFTPIVGYFDDFATIAIAFSSVCLHIKDEHKEKANKIINKFFK